MLRARVFLGQTPRFSRSPAVGAAPRRQGRRLEAMVGLRLIQHEALAEEPDEGCAS